MRRINVAAERTQEEVTRALANIGTFQGVDRCVLMILREGGEGVKAFHWFAEHLEPRARRLPSDNSFVQFPWLMTHLRAGRPVVIHDVHELPPEATSERDYATSVGIRSTTMVGTQVGDRLAALALDAMREPRRWTDDVVSRLYLLGAVLAGAVIRADRDQEIDVLRRRLQAENVYLREEITLRQRHEEIIGESEAIRRVLGQVEQVAPQEATVLLQGETGTGKELVARAIHRLSPRRDRPLVSVNCAALTPTLIESELFGREKGAYTGALSKQVGRFEIANGSTLFLDEIGELAPETQAKLLRVLERGEFERVGSPATVRVDVRVVAASNRDLQQMVRLGTFRSDLYFRLAVFLIEVPPLRARREDIPLLMWAFVREFGTSMGRSVTSVPKSCVEALTRYPWPGNVREFRNTIERAMIGARGPILHVEPPPQAEALVPSTLTLEEVERRHITATLEKTGWRVRGPGGAAERLGLRPTTLESRMQKLGITRKERRPS